VRLSKKHKGLVLWAIVVLATVALLAVIEIGGRLYIYLSYGVPGKTYGLWRYDEVLGAQHRENAYNSNAQTNNYGFRGIEDVYDPKPVGSLRIIVYGGSTTYCYNLSNTETWSYQLERALREAPGHEQDQVLNGGAILWSLGHVYARAKKDIPLLKPDYVIIYSGINEEVNANTLELDGIKMEQLVNKGKYGIFSKNLSQNKWYVRNLVTWRLLHYRVVPFLRSLKVDTSEDVKIIAEQSSKIEQNNSVRWYVLDNYLHVLENLIVFLKDNNVKPIFVVQVSGKSDPFTTRLISYSREGAKLAEKMGVQVVEPTAMLEDYVGDPMDLFYKTGVHYSRDGARRFAQLIFKKAFALNILQ